MKAWNRVYIYMILLCPTRRPRMKLDLKLYGRSELVSHLTKVQSHHDINYDTLQNNLLTATSSSIQHMVPRNHVPLQDSLFPLFDEVKAEHVVPGITQLLDELNAELDELEQKVQPTWTRLVEPLERLTDRLSLAWGTVSHLKVCPFAPLFTQWQILCLSQASHYDGGMYVVPEGLPQSREGDAGSTMEFNANVPERL